ncbi:MAG: hypothetical protein RLY93_02050 [Sumerlaeia bacterium]
MLYMILVAWVWVMTVTTLTILLWRATPRVAEAPLLDLVLSLMTWVPWVAAGIWQGWPGFFGCLIGQIVALQTFILIHEMTSPRPCGSIRKTLDKFVGPTRNHLGLWVTVPALPAFIFLRFSEMFLYPLLVKTLNFPHYKQSEWVNVSRQKFEGLIGHDLIWCLYCDWMTGVYSLGAEMLRSVESFWCPIKFYPGKKCENCRITFPDHDVWVPHDGSMKDVEAALEEHYSPDPDSPRSWWGHPERAEAADGAPQAEAEEKKATD